ncbi:MAG TPA: cobalt chelatase, partial [Burkholderiaceae bacterium]
MSDAQRQARQQECIEELCAAAVRALSGERDLHFRGRRLHRGRRALPLYAPHLAPSLATDDFSSFRGAADGFGLRLANSDAALHQTLCPTDPVERMVFELLEQFRAEALVPAGMPGVRRNLRHRFEAWSLAFHHAGGTDTARGLLMYTVAQICRARVTGEPVVEETEDQLEATRAGISPLIGVALAGLKPTRTDQAAYALHARSLARTIAGLLTADGTAASLDQDDDDRARDDAAVATFSLLPDPGEAIDDAIASAVSGRSLVLDDAADGYRIFTRAHDREHAAASLVRAEQLAEYRARLDERIAGLGLNIARLARELKAVLAQPARDGWDGGQEEGQLDGRRLAQLVASPTERRLFRTEREEPRADCLVSVLIDCSGSMKEHIESVAV